MADQSQSADDVLVVEQDEHVRAGLAALLGGAGFEITAVADHERARDQLVNRFFSVMLVELDGPSPQAGLQLVRETRARSPRTSIIVLTPRRTFEDVAAAFRAGALDVVPKTQDQLPYLGRRVGEAVKALQADRARDRLLEDVAQLHDRFLSQMIALARQVSDLEDRLANAQGESTAASAIKLGALNLLIVDDDPAVAKLLIRSLDGDDWKIRSAESSGGALDIASQFVPQVMVVKETLPDLPPSMLVSGLRSAAPELVVLMYRTPAAGVEGEIRLVDGSRVTTVIPSFVNPAQLLAALEDVREALTRKVRERRQIAAFRSQHADFLKSYSGLKQRLGAKP